MARSIDGDALIAWIKGSQQMTSKMKNIICYIKTMPTVNAVEAVRCKDCKYHNTHRCFMAFDMVATEDNGYCYMGVKETDHE